MRDLLRDEALLSQVLRRRLLRSIIRATGVLRDCGRGKDVGDENLRAASTLVRLAPRVMLPPPPPEENDYFMSAQMWTLEKMLGMEILGRYYSREGAAARWRRVFDMNGPREGFFQTRAEAADYGRKRFDNYDENRTESRRRYEAGESRLYVY